MQHPAHLPAINPNTLGRLNSHNIICSYLQIFILDIDVEDYVARRFIKKRGKNKSRGRILEAHANVKDLNLIESKMNFIKVNIYFINILSSVINSFSF